MAAQGRTFGSSPSVVAAAVGRLHSGARGRSCRGNGQAFPGDRRRAAEHRPVRGPDRARALGARSRPGAVPRGGRRRRADRDGLERLLRALDGKPAAWSPAVQRLLRNELGFTGVTITDALDGAAATRGRPLPSVAVLSAQAGVDLLLLIGSEASSDARLRQGPGGGAAGPDPSRRRSSEATTGSRR